MVKFTVPGKPQGKGRPRFAKRGAYVQTYTPETTKQYESLVLLCWRQQSGVTFEKGTPLAVSIKAHFPIPKSLSKRKQAALMGAPHLAKCDCDNLAKIVLDAISGIVFHDDAEVCSLMVTKDYSDNPRVDVEVAECRSSGATPPKSQ